MLNIVVPMAGRGQRFTDAGYTLPKPLIAVHDVPMIRLVIANLTPDCPHRFHFLLQREHAERYRLDALLRDWAPGCTLTLLDGVTDGAACTVLLAREAIDNDNPLMIANCDQYIDAEINTYLAAQQGADGLIMTMWADDAKWSFVRRNADGRVTGVVEKEVVSNEATVGIYNFARGRDFVRAADAMIAADLRVNGEFYVAPAYDRLIAEGGRVVCHSIGGVGSGMYGIGTPADLEAFLALPLSRQAVAGVLPSGGTP
ncbi:glycosyltransferase family 2 protein [Roseinatronobacter sp. S2]|uniref:glycosyltransferase family 2 protein n=1 Tax=Roseinatronobacter sp. S2 TaxID=3035471 RepID=UPI00240FF56A|nr:glycosyltransferase family 2 protein [Roseinatronobacter sp. S2]WFE77066.1 glycosyltransferase family 2 protein [Roseinatronobacter sp. S2]